IYGSPVPGYAAPTDTIDPATEVPRVLLGILADLAPQTRSGQTSTPRSGAALNFSPALLADLRALRDIAEANPSDETLLLGLESWAQILGMISMELFGHLNNVVTDRADFFTMATSQMAKRIAASSS
ncbi:MAG: TetR/AcrR family transcriptional regulator, partial [Actinobacteria bacterium]|nr:TetR/AcrR family transcriptional regulator [Actinomycetota bacterium]